MRPLPLLRRLAAVLLIGAASSASFGAQAAAASTPNTGDPAPDYLGRNLDRDVMRLNQYAGQPVVISFWATWCPYCLKELPILSGIRKASRGAVRVITVNTEERDTFRNASRLMKDLDLDLLYDPDHKARDGYRVTGLPH